MSKQLTKAVENPADWLSQRLPKLVALNLQQPALPDHIYHYILNFIANNLTPQQIADFRPTLEMQDRLQTLLSRSRAATLTPIEQTELYSARLGGLLFTTEETLLESIFICF